MNRPNGSASTHRAALLRAGIFAAATALAWPGGDIAVEIDAALGRALAAAPHLDMAEAAGALQEGARLHVAAVLQSGGDWLGSVGVETDAEFRRAVEGADRLLGGLREAGRAHVLDLAGEIGGRLEALARGIAESGVVEAVRDTASEALGLLGDAVKALAFLEGLRRLVRRMRKLGEGEPDAADPSGARETSGEAAPTTRPPVDADRIEIPSPPPRAPGACRTCEAPRSRVIWAAPGFDHDEEREATPTTTPTTTPPSRGTEEPRMLM